MARHIESPVRIHRQSTRRQPRIAEARDTATGLRTNTQRAELELSRLATELHDRVAQSLWGLDAELVELSKLIERDPELAQNRLQPVRQHVAEAYQDVRLAIGALRTAPPVNTPLIQSIETCVQRFAERSGLDFRWECSAGSVELPKLVQLQLLAILSQALQNVWKHASATMVGVTLDDRGDTWLLRIRDNGRGLPVRTAGETETPGHFGVAIMGERARSFGGSVDIQPNPDTGVTVSVWIPKVSVAAGALVTSVK